MSGASFNEAVRRPFTNSALRGPQQSRQPQHFAESAPLVTRVSALKRGSPSKDVDTSLRQVLLRAGTLLLAMLCLVPLWNAWALLTDANYVFWVGRVQPCWIVFLCFAVMALYVATIFFFTQQPRSSVDGRTIITIGNVFVMLLGILLMVVALPISRDSMATYENLMYRCESSEQTHRMFEYSQVLHNIRSTPECMEEVSVEFCAGYSDAAPYTSFLRAMESNYQCSGFCYEPPAPAPEGGRVVAIAPEYEDLTKPCPDSIEDYEALANSYNAVGQTHRRRRRARSRSPFDLRRRRNADSSARRRNYQRSAYVPRDYDRTRSSYDSRRRYESVRSNYQPREYERSSYDSRRRSDREAREVRDYDSRRRSEREAYDSRRRRDYDSSRRRLAEAMEREATIVEDTAVAAEEDAASTGRQLAGELDAPLDTVTDTTRRRRTYDARRRRTYESRRRRRTSDTSDSPDSSEDSSDSSYVQEGASPSKNLLRSRGRIGEVNATHLSLLAVGKHRTNVSNLSLLTLSETDGIAKHDVATQLPGAGNVAADVASDVAAVEGEVADNIAGRRRGSYDSRRRSYNSDRRSSTYDSSRRSSDYDSNRRRSSDYDTRRRRTSAAALSDDQRRRRTCDRSGAEGDANPVFATQAARVIVPPALFSKAQYDVSCEGMAARDIKNFGTSVGTQTFYQGVYLVIVAITMGVLNLVGLCVSDDQSERLTA